MADGATQAEVLANLQVSGVSSAVPAVTRYAAEWIETAQSLGRSIPDPADQSGYLHRV